MKKYYKLLMLLSIGMVYGQKGRVGINTTNPESTLDVRAVKLSELPVGQAQGITFPNFTTEERQTFQNVRKGTVIYNMTRDCLEIYTSKNGIDGWYCMGVIEQSPELSTRLLSQQAILENQNVMLQDGEVSAILLSGEERGFYLKEMLQVKKVNADQYRIRNFLPHTFKNVEVYYKTSSMEKAVKIAVLDEVGPLAEINEILPFSNTPLRFEDETGVVNVFENTALKSSDYTVFLNVKNDVLYDKMKTIKHQTFIRFEDYYTEGGNWGKILPEHARGYLPILANMAYLYSSDKFKERFLTYPYDLYDNNKNLIDRQLVYESIFKVPNQNLGVVEKVEGLGGGSVFGIHSRFLAVENDFYIKTQTWSREVWSHEYGHVLGFSHNSNMTYKDGVTKKGYVDIVIELYGEMLDSGELPFIKSPYVQ